MLFLLFFIIGMIFVLLISPLLDLFVSLINSIVAEKIHNIQKNIEADDDIKEEKQPMGFFTNCQSLEEAEEEYDEE
ncbi:MAG: hypothetical protein IKN65_06760 [Clostridia bacterium]|nr:hypothetical protein [Clostridia bacterium]